MFSSSAMLSFLSELAEMASACACALAQRLRAEEIW